MDFEDDDEMSIQFGVSVDHDGQPVVLMVLPDVTDEDTGEPIKISIGDPYSVSVFVGSALRTARVAEAAAELLTGDESKDEVERLLFDCAMRISAEYN